MRTMAFGNPMFQVEHIFGFHDPGGEPFLFEAGRSGWVVVSETIGHSPNDRTGKDFTPLTSQGLGVIVRLNNGYFPQGTLPRSRAYGDFARRCANFVAASRGPHIWIIGNEMNYAVERPGAQPRRNLPAGGRIPGDPTLRSLPERFDALLPPGEGPSVDPAEDGEAITPEMYAQCYRLCRSAIHQVPGHEQDQVLVGAVAPWNTNTRYPGNPTGDWITYFQDILLLLGPHECDGIALHAYTHGPDPARITDDREAPGFPQRRQQFRAYRDFMEAIPVNMRSLPVYITEADQVEPWEDVNSGWVQAAYAEIDAWNRDANNQKIRCLALYRWPQIDRWFIEGKQGVIEDFRMALRYDYRWDGRGATEPAESPGPTARAGATTYQVEWLQVQAPHLLTAGQVITMPVTVRNLGSWTWPQAGPNPVRLAYRFLQAGQEAPLRPEQQLRTSLPKDVRPGEVVTLQAQVALPDAPGPYTLELDLVHEDVTWFGEQGADRWRRHVHVEEEQTSPVETEPMTANPSFAAAHLGAAIPAQAASTPVEPPQIVDISASLPKGDRPYETRPLDRIRRIVINHTAAPPTIPIQVIAQAHVDRGYPGIAYDYFVDGQGRIFQVSPLESVVKADADWSGGGVNICLAGNFTQAPPSEAQLAATAALCAWLVSRFGLAVEDIVGLRELLQTASPGDTFLSGPAWKNDLLGRVRRLLASRPSVPTPTEPTPTGPRPTEPSRPAQGTKAPRPPIRDVSAQLPRDPSGFFTRRPEDVRYVVINHTAAPPDVPVETIAQAFRQKLPGILYQFFITGEGEILQTQPLHQVVDGERPYIANAVNVAFAGDFTDAAPTPAQLEAGGRLIAWLLGELPQLTLDSIRGVSEFIPHGSPGEQWLRGRRWKDMLLNEVVRALQAGETGGGGQAAIDELERRLRETQQQNEALQGQLDQLRRENERLRLEIQELRSEPGRWRQVTRPVIHDIVDELPRHPTLRYPTRPRVAITHIAVHHTAMPPHVGPERIAAFHIQADPDRGKDEWPGIGYHFFIHVDGRIDQTQPLEAASYHVADHNRYTVGVAFAGSFLNGVAPTPQQIQAGARLIAWLMQELNVPLQNVWGHREFAGNRTVCPGSEWMQGRKWRDQLFAEIVRIQSGEGEPPIHHYLLFWQRPYPGPYAAEDLRNAEPYIERFRPTLGFSVEEAAHARYVTIVGGEAGVSGEDELRLKEAGVQVERIAGEDEEDTARMLRELAEQGRRFQHLLEEPTP